MTRDITGLRDGHDPASEDDVYAALWATAPFPRLPEDAPDQLKDFVVDIDDPRRLYTIHRAARRHQFQILVERYIFQLRYGCKVQSCNTTTCFSCRKRVAGAAPVRRYNAISARTIAIHLASQDNPERGLCHNPSADRPIAQSPKPTKRRNDNKSLSTSNGAAGSGSRRDKNFATGILLTKAQASGSNESEGDSKKPGLKGLRSGERNPFKIPVLEKPPPTDHRSYVQNVLGTAAFKMLEWLTPRSLEALSRPDDRFLELSNGGVAAPANADVNKQPFHNISQNESREMLKRSINTIEKKPQPSKSEPQAVIRSPTKPSYSTNSKPPAAADPTQVASSLKRRSSKITSGKKPEPSETPSPKNTLNLTSRIPDTDLLAQFHSSGPKGRLSRQLITNPSTHIASTDARAPIKSVPIRVLTEARREPNRTAEVGRKEERTPTDSRAPPIKAKKQVFPEPSPVKDVCLPQSISLLPIDLLNFLCDILQMDGTLEKHDLEPREVDMNLKRWLNDNSQLTLCRSLSLDRGDSRFEKEQWRMFIEQSFFDVLSKPDSLIQSFSYCDQRLYDTQTIWYLMLRLTRVAPSLVFDSLWNVAGALFKPPEALELIQDWKKEPQPLSTISSKSLSNNEAARIINICLHALVAAAPLVSDERQLANMSRIRSYGLVMFGREPSPLGPPKLCLQYEDAFTNDLALRLARRVFASIPTRRRFAELLEAQNNARSDERKEPDVLDGVLATLKFLDLGTTPALNFLDQERDLHEKRVPTLLLDWARTVMLQDWNGSAEVSADGSFGGALAMVAAIYKHRKSLLLGDIHFRTEYFAERLDPVGMPLEWLSFEANKRTVHLLDYPYLFNPSTLVTYFRAINYSRMNQAYETAKATTGLMHSTISETSLMTDQSARYRLFERLRVATSKFLVLEIGRQSVLTDTFNAIWRREERELMRPVKIRLGEEDGEEGMDSGGVQQEFFRLAIAEALDPEYGTFTIDTRTKMTWFQPGSLEPLWKFELIGMIISLAVYNGLTLPVTFPKALYRKLLSQDVTELHHIADGWPDLANGLTSLLEWDEKDGLVEDIFARTYEFSIEQFGQPVSREMGKCSSWPQFSDIHISANPEDAVMVTNENRNNYVSDYIYWLTNVSVKPQFEAFQKGFFTCVDKRSLSLFDPDTLQSVVEGIQEIDISELRRATRYIGWDASHRTIRDFWSIVKRYDLNQKRKLLEFVTASDRVPVGGMRNLQFTLQRNGIDDGHLPSSYTCYGILLLPEYSGKDVLRQKLAMSLENSKGFGFA